MIKEDGSIAPFVACPNGKELLEKDIAAVSQVFLFLKSEDTQNTVILFKLIMKQELLEIQIAVTVRYVKICL